jgi:hypothetical protein
MNRQKIEIKGQLGNVRYIPSILGKRKFDVSSGQSNIKIYTNEEIEDIIEWCKSYLASKKK